MTVVRKHERTLSCIDTRGDAPMTDAQSLAAWVSRAGHMRTGYGAQKFEDRGREVPHLPLLAFRHDEGTHSLMARSTPAHAATSPLVWAGQRGNRHRIEATIALTEIPTQRAAAKSTLKRYIGGMAAAALWWCSLTGREFRRTREANVRPPLRGRDGGTSPREESLTLIVGLSSSVEDIIPEVDGGVTRPTCK